MHKERGFTLIEMLLSISIMGILAAVSLPIYQSFQTRNDLDLATQSLASALRRAQVYTRAVSGDSQWGVEIQASSITLFKGAVFSSRDSAYDETSVYPASISATGDNEVLFAKLSGAPDTATSITLTSNNNDTRTVSINAKGMVSY